MILNVIQTLPVNEMTLPQWEVSHLSAVLPFNWIFYSRGNIISSTTSSYFQNHSVLFSYCSGWWHMSFTKIQPWPSKKSKIKCYHCLAIDLLCGREIGYFGFYLCQILTKLMTVKWSLPLKLFQLHMIDLNIVTNTCWWII